MTETIVINISVTDYIIIKCRAFIIQPLDVLHCPVTTEEINQITIEISPEYKCGILINIIKLPHFIFMAKILPPKQFAKQDFCIYAVK